MKKLTLGNPQCPCCLRIAQSLLDRLHSFASKIGNATRAQRSMGRDCGGALIPAPQAGQRNVRPRFVGSGELPRTVETRNRNTHRPGQKSVFPSELLSREREKVKPQILVCPFASSRTVACGGEIGRMGERAETHYIQSSTSSEIAECVHAHDCACNPVDPVPGNLANRGQRNATGGFEFYRQQELVP